MVFSKIKQTIEYQEDKTIDLLDKHTSFNVYEHTLFCIDVEICIGNINNSNKIYNVLFCPVYLVKPNSHVVKIGIIEFTPLQMSYIFDENNDVNLDNVHILLYSFVTQSYIQSMIGHENDSEPKPVIKSITEPEKITESVNTKISKNIQKKEKLNITEVNEIKLNEIKLNVNSSSKNSRKNKKDIK